MNLKGVTITGADNSVSVNELRRVSEDFPFVEWGILASSKHTDSQRRIPRFPNRRWIYELQEFADYEFPGGIALHLCGGWVRQLLLGHVGFPADLTANFSRVQLNFHGELELKFEESAMVSAVKSLNRTLIFQLDGAHGENLLDIFYANEGLTVAYPLFDCSHGAGITPTNWPKPIYLADQTNFLLHGYAGGLGPENLREQLPRIADAAGATPFWIDMETKVRSNGDSQFDLGKVRRCLEICAPFIES